MHTFNPSSIDFWYKTLKLLLVKFSNVHERKGRQTESNKAELIFHFMISSRIPKNQKLTSWVRTCAPSSTLCNPWVWWQMINTDTIKEPHLPTCNDAGCHCNSRGTIWWSWSRLLHVPIVSLTKWFLFYNNNFLQTNTITHQLT